MTEPRSFSIKVDEELLTDAGAASGYNRPWPRVPVAARPRARRRRRPT